MNLEMRHTKAKARATVRSETLDPASGPASGLGPTLNYMHISHHGEEHEQITHTLNMYTC